MDINHKIARDKKTQPHSKVSKTRNKFSTEKEEIEEKLGFKGESKGEDVYTNSPTNGAADCDTGQNSV